MLANQAIAWMLTYLLHSTLLLGLAWLVSKPLSRWSVAAEETVWKLALVGALFTASLQFAAAGWEPLAGRWGIADLPASSPVAYVEEGIAPVPVVRAEAPRVSIPQAPPAPAPAPSFRPSLPSLPSLALGVWGLGAAFLLMVYGSSLLRLRSRMRPRPRVVGGTLFSQLRSMALEAGLVEEIRLSCSSRVPVPLAMGVRRGEICVPPRALAGLTQEQQEGMLAHELAHLVRRDPFWLAFSNFVSALFFFQPLNWVARRRMREISEVLSDEWAVSRTGRPLSLAGCLAEVAGWSMAPRSLPVPGMADRPSHLAQRIRRLLDETRSPEHPARRLWLGAGMAVLVIVVAAAAPAISAARPDSPEPEEISALASLDESSARELPGTQEKSPTPQTRREGDDEVLDFEYDEEKFEEEFEDTFEEAFEKEFSKFDKEFEFEFEFPEEHEFKFDHEFEFELGDTIGADVEAIAAQAMASVDLTLANMDLQHGSRFDGRELSEEERERLEEQVERAARDAERVTEQVNRELAPKMEKLSRELSEKFNASHSAEMEKLAAEMAELAQRMRPSSEEMSRFQAQMEKYRRDRGDYHRRLTEEEREQVRREARDMARRMRPSDEDREKMRALRDEMRKRHSEMRQKFMAEHGDEIERNQREMREEIERHMQGVREEVRRTIEQNRHLREDHHHQRELRQRELQRERQRRHEERKERQRDREDGDNDSSGPSF